MNSLAAFTDLALHSPLFWVVVAAVILGWLDHRRQIRNLQDYDAWWFWNLRGAAQRWLGRSRD